MPKSHFSAGRARSRGFTLIEILIAVVVVAVLGMVALPSFLDSIRKSRRSEAFSAIAAVQQAQERSRGNFPSYCPNLASAPSLSTCGLALPAQSSNGRYALAISGPPNAPNAAGYTLTATAQGAQTSDTRCATLGVRVEDGTVKYGGGASSIDWAATDSDPNRCWAK